MNSKTSNSISIFEINRLNKSRKVSSDLGKDRKEIQLPKLKENISKDSRLDYWHAKDN